MVPRMADFQVKVRNLETGEMLVASMPDSDTAIEWLKERPKNVEIVSVLSDTSPAESARLKEAMRPYDMEEMKLKEAFDRKAAEAALEQYGKELEMIEQAQAEADGEQDELDPNRPISVKYDMDDGLVVVEDKRELTDAAKAACMAWIEERSGWIKDKGQTVGEAHIDVWPNEVPGGDEEKRVLEGSRFFPRLIN